MPEKDPYTIDCPKCGAHFDCKEELEKWKIAVMQTLKTLDMIKELAKKL